MTGFTALQSEVIGIGLCTDCGTCAAVCPTGAITMNFETEEPQLDGKCLPKCRLCYETCPGKDINLPELNHVTFGREPNADEGLLGVSQAFLKGYAVDEKIRNAGAGGGVVSALLVYALEKGIIDAAAVTAMSIERPWRVVPKLATSREEIIACAQSRYALVPTNSTISKALAAGFKRLGVVGLPCNIHGLRKIQAISRPKQLSIALEFVIGLFCAIGTSYRGTEHTIEELCGVPLVQVNKVEYRGGEYPGNFIVTTKEGKVVSITSAQRKTVSGCFNPDRCIMCYDYPAELADISVGDYFHPDRKKYAPGWSVIIARSDKGQKLLSEAEAVNYLHLEPVHRDYLLGFGFERKRHGAVYHLRKRQRYGWPIPNYHKQLDEPKPMRQIFHMIHP